MTTYTACFQGRKVGAIGVMSYFNVDIEANDTTEAEAKLYDTHEHISRLFWLWRGKQTVNKHEPIDVARCGKYYVSTYTGEGWMQTNSKGRDVRLIKREHLDRLEDRP